MMNVKVSMNEDEIRAAIVADLANRTGITINPSDVVIEVKSTQNYKSEWEQARIRAEFMAVVKGPR